jgi:hypothetical protein
LERASATCPDELTGEQESELTRLVEKVLGLDGLPRFVSA